MKRKQIPSDNFHLSICRAWKKNWFLLTSGDFTAGKYNTMTVAWGSFGYMWNRPFAMVVVRPSRYTYEFMEKYPSFTLSLFPPGYAKKLNYCGSNSGRDVDKIKECGLTPIASSNVEAPAFDEAELIVECKKIYFDDYKPERFLDKTIDTNYRVKDYHRIYFGQIEAIQGVDKYLQS